MSDTLNINLYVGTMSSDDEARRLATILNEAIEHHGLAMVEHEKPEPVPTPEWRKMVDATKGTVRDPLPFVLQRLAEIGREERVQQNLAYIVAVCEQQVGDGWQAKSDRFGYETPLSAWGLLFAFGYECDRSGPVDEDWEALAGHAAYWLASLTGEAS